MPSRLPVPLRLRLNPRNSHTLVDSAIHSIRASDCGLPRWTRLTCVEDAAHPRKPTFFFFLSLRRSDSGSCDLRRGGCGQRVTATGPTSLFPIIEIHSARCTLRSTIIDEHFPSNKFAALDAGSPVPSFDGAAALAAPRPRHSIASARLQSDFRPVLLPGQLGLEEVRAAAGCVGQR